jgi:hypothetical protein
MDESLACEYWRRYLSSGDSKADDYISQNRDEMVRHLASCEACAGEALKSKDGADRLSKYINLRPVYTDKENQLLKALREAAQNESAVIANAVETYLIPAVKSESQELTAVPSEFPDLTPLQRFQGIQAVELLVKRNKRRWQTEDVAARPDGSVRFGKDGIKRQILVNEIASYAGIPKDSASPLLDWIWTTSKRVPRIFPEFICLPQGGEVILLPEVKLESDSDSEVDLGDYLADRWQPPKDKALRTSDNAPLTRLEMNCTFKGKATVETDILPSSSKDVSFTLSFDSATPANVSPTSEIDINNPLATIKSDLNYPLSGTFDSTTGQLNLPMKFDVTPKGFNEFSIRFPTPGLTTDTGTVAGPYQPQGKRMDANGNLTLRGASTISGVFDKDYHVQVTLDGSISPVPGAPPSGRS